MKTGALRLGLLALSATAVSIVQAAVAPSSPVMLARPWVPASPHDIDFEALPKIASQPAGVSDVMAAGGHRVNQHNYLGHFADARRAARAVSCGVMGAVIQADE